MSSNESSSPAYHHLWTGFATVLLEVFLKAQDSFSPVVIEMTLQCCAVDCAKSLQSCPTLCSSIDCNPTGSSVPGITPDKNTGVGCHVLLQGIFPTQGSNMCLLCLLHWQADSLPLGRPLVLVASSFWNRLLPEGVIIISSCVSEQS